MRFLRIPYIILQIFALMWFIFIILLYVVDPYTHILRNSIWCKWIPYSVQIITCPFYTIYLWLIFVRLHNSFKNSRLALSSPTLQSLAALIVVIPIGTALSLVFDDGFSYCIKTWSAPDLRNKISYCAVSKDDVIFYKYNIIVICIIWISAINLLLALIFTMKTVKLLNMARSRIPTAATEDEKLTLREVVVRNGSLTIVGCIVTILGLFTCTYILVHFTCN